MSIKDATRIPQIEKILQHSFLAPYIDRLSRPVVTSIVRENVDEYKKSCLENGGFSTFDCNKLYALIENRCKKVERQRLKRVINATGVVVHTNLGRSPIDAELWQSVTELNTSYCNLELDLQTGKRGKRKGLVPQLMNKLVKGEDTLVVNNNASSIYLMLHELAKGKEVIVSRGEQVQIGGGFRIPDILAQSGATLVEVGATNITTLDDYLDAVTENTAMVLVVHTSNYKIRGFTHSPDLADLAKHLPEHVILAVDQGSGVSSEPFVEEISVNKYLKSGADIVCFSGDKIIGGPQAGFITGKQALIQRMEKNPMMRAFRPGRIVYSLIEELMVRKLNNDASGCGVAEKRYLRPKAMLKKMADQLVAIYPEKLSAEQSDMTIGGGSLPDESYPSWSVKIQLDKSPERILTLIRNWPIPVIGVVSQNSVYLNMATLSEDDLNYIAIQLQELFTPCIL
jgi:L-seryl-tRNA(Ser) seleniumtransferase